MAYEVWPQCFAGGLPGAHCRRSSIWAELWRECSELAGQCWAVEDDQLPDAGPWVSTDGDGVR